ncbi:MAG: DHHA1 domain-containing protein [Candidatus Micrarchaeaceae archaeon]
MYVISHASDLDGVASAALLMRLFRVEESYVFFAEHSAPLLKNMFKRIRKSNCDVLFVADFSVNNKEIGMWLNFLGALKRTGSRIYWFDHHKWPSAADRIASMCDFAEYGENKRYCTTEIVERLLFKKDKYAAKLAKIAHYSDFAVRAKHAGIEKIISDYDLAITYFNTLSATSAQAGLRSLASSLSSGILLSKDIVRVANSFKSKSDREIEKALKNISYVSGIAVVFSSSSVVQQDLFEKLFNISGSEIVMQVDVDRSKASMRSKRTDISALAMAMGGGGHPHAAGFSISKSYRLKSEKGKRLFLQKLENKVKGIDYANIA